MTAIYFPLDTRMLKEGFKSTFQTDHTKFLASIRNIKPDGRIIHKADRVHLFHLLHHVFHSNPMLCI